MRDRGQRRSRTAREQQRKGRALRRRRRARRWTERRRSYIRPHTVTARRRRPIGEAVKECGPCPAGARGVLNPQGVERAAAGLEEIGPKLIGGGAGGAVDRRR